MAACDRVKVMALTNEEFESALKHLPRRLAAKNVEIARAILVQGRRSALFGIRTVPAFTCAIP